MPLQLVFTMNDIVFSMLLGEVVLLSRGRKERPPERGASSPHFAKCTEANSDRQVRGGPENMGSTGQSARSI